jgi:hypothetical protein
VKRAVTTLPAAILLPEPLVAWLEERGTLTLGALMRLAPRPRNLAEAGLDRKGWQRVSLRIRRAVGLRWPQIAARVAADEALARIEIRRRPFVGPQPVTAPQRVEERRRQVEAGLLESFRALLDEQPEMPRRALASRLGLDGPARSLKEAAREVGVRPSRLSQLRAAACARIRADVAWVDEVRRRVDGALGGGSVPLAELARERWWAAAAAQPEALFYIARKVLGGAFGRIELDGEVLVASAPALEVEAVYRDARAALGRLPVPAPLSAVKALLAPAERFGPRAVELLFARLRASITIEGQGDGAWVTAADRSARTLLLARLVSSPEPLLRASLPPLLRNVDLPPEVIRFGPDLVGLARHFPDMDAWAERLVPVAVRALDDGGPERQCHAGELLEAVREQVAIPRWLTEWHLAALLERSGRTRPLGRQRFAPLSAPAGSKRVFLRDRITRILREHGEPMPLLSLAEAVAQEASVTMATLRRILAAPSFLASPGPRIGLLDRDLPGGEPARARAVEHVARTLARRRVGLDNASLAAEIHRLSPDHARWAPATCRCVMRTDPRLRLVQGGSGVGLARWESPRVKRAGSKGG